MLPACELKTRRAEELLIELLSDGPMAVAELEALFASQDIGFDTAKDAKARLGVESQKQGKVWFWHFPNHAS